jgi:hypothetical protein
MRLLKRREQGAVATYAAVLDGVHLWLDVAGTVAVREGRTTTELGPAPCDLTPLASPDGDATYDVLVDGAPVSLEPRAGSPLTRTPLSPDGRTQWQVEPGDPLRLHRRTVEPTARLDAVTQRGDTVHLELSQTQGGHLLLLDTDDRVLTTLPASADSGTLQAAVAVENLPAGHVGVLRVAVGTEQEWLRVRRRDNDLADPNHAVLLPELHADGRLVARLRWNPDGLLALRVLGDEDRP